MRWLDPEVTVPATDTVVPLADAKAHLRVDTTDDDALISLYLAAAEAHIEQVTGLRLATQTLRLRAWGFEGHTFQLPAAPIQSISGITYLDPTGATQTLDPSVYVSDLFGIHPAISRAYNKVWPAHLVQLGSVTLTAVCGFATSACPPPIIAAIKLMVGSLYINRADVVIDDSRVTLIENPTADALLANFRRAYV